MIRVGWDLEEMVALVDLYLRTKGAKSTVLNSAIDKLTTKLNRRAEILQIPHDERFRNRNGLFMMLMNLRNIESKGTSGLSSTSKLMSDVWEMYRADKEQFERILLEFNARYGIQSLENHLVTTVAGETNVTTSDDSNSYNTEEISEQSADRENDDQQFDSPSKNNIHRSRETKDIGAAVINYIQENNLPLFETWATYLNLDENPWENCLLEQLALSVRAFNCLRRMNLDTVGKLLNSTICQTASVRGMGSKSFEEIVKKLKSLNRIGGSLPTSKNEKVACSPSFVNEELKKYRDLILAEEWVALDALEVSAPVKDVIEKLKENCKVLGKELSRSLLQASSEMLNVLSNIREKLDSEREIREKVQSALAALPKERLDLLAEGMLRAYLPDRAILQEALLGYFGGVTARLRDVERNFQHIQHKDLRIVLSFLKWCAFDISSSLETFMNTVQEKPRNMMILTLRSQDQTLQEVGERCELTRERVRQIEQKIRRQFIAYENQENLLLKISALRNGDSVLTAAEVKPYLGENADCLLYLLTTSPSSQYTYNRRLHTFVIGCEEVASQVEQFVDSLPEQFKIEEFDDFVDRAELEEGLPAELVRIQMDDVYSRSGTFYHRGHLTLTEMYRQTLRNHYPNGFHIYDESKLTEFKQQVLMDYGQDVKLPENNRALSARIADIGILCGRGMYRPKAETYIPDELADRIRQYIVDFESPILLTNTIFAAFEDELIKYDVDNKYYLQGILGELYGEDFIFTRDYVSKDANVTSLYSTIVEYIKEYDYPVPKSLLMEHFPGIPEIVMNLATADASVVNFFGEYMHRDRLRLSADEKQILRNHLQDFLADGKTHTSRELFARLNNAAPQILRRAYIQFHFALFSVCECLFAEDAQFHRPYLAQHGVELVREEEILLNFLRENQSTSIEELLDFTERTHYRVNNILELLDSLNDEYFIVDQDSLVTVASSGITEELCRAIEEEILAETEDCTPIRSLVCLYTLPKISIKWTEWLIYSMLKKWSTRLEVSASYSQFRYAIPLVAPNGKMTSEAIDQIGMAGAQSDNFEVEDLEDLVADILLEEGDFDDFA